jgi:DinB superfamily
MGEDAAKAGREPMNELQRILVADGVGAPPSHVLEAIDDRLAHSRLPGGPHSIYEEVWHLAFWLELSLDWVEGRLTPYPEHASAGFPKDAAESWEVLKVRFLSGLKTAAALSGDSSRMEAPVTCLSRIPGERRVMPARDQMEGIATHNAYHLGRIVLLRQLLGAWPPPSGGDTW